MYSFIDCLKIIAMALITNAHYENIYPLSIIANGGLLGDMIFFAVSGFCLFNIKDDFLKWYSKRISRIYPSVWLVTLICLAVQYYQTDFTISSIFSLFIYPTEYHFIASILFDYILFYCIVMIIKQVNTEDRKVISIITTGIISIYLIYYFAIFDKTYYHIDSVYEFHIRILFLIAMLIGATFKINIDQYISKQIKIVDIVITAICFLSYFISKMIFSKYVSISEFQIIPQIFLILLLCYIFKISTRFEDLIYKKSKRFRNFLSKTASLTLEVYLIQYLIISKYNKGPFPLNFIITTLMILFSGYIINYLVGFLRRKKLFGRVIKK